MKAAAIIVAAGTGSRMGQPKQFLPLGGKTVCEWALHQFLGAEDVAQVVMVMSPENVKKHGSRLSALDSRIVCVEGGETRMGSVRNGFAKILEDADVVAVHDGARPLITPAIIKACIDEAEQSGAALPAVPVKDTLKKVTNKQGWISGTPTRSAFWGAQTPQCYRREILAEALEKYPEEDKATDESQLVEKAGHRVKIVPSSYENFKITTPEDMVMAEALLEERKGGRRRTAVGFGFDIHKLAAGRELWLAGVKLDHSKGLVGHSDGDAVLHAAGDAVLGALGAGEIGMMFPPENPKIKGIQSKDIIAAVMAKLITAGGAISNLDVTLVAEEPKLKPHYDKFRASLAELFNVDAARVNLKAKSHEGIGEIGKGEAIACYASATLSLPS